MKAWEYNVLNLGNRDTPHEDIWTSLDKAGEDSWELVSVVPLADYDGQTCKLLAFLKRRVSGA
jgi:hypothetical protein